MIITTHLTTAIYVRINTTSTTAKKALQVAKVFLYIFFIKNINKKKKNAVLNANSAKIITIVLNVRMSSYRLVGFVSVVIIIIYLKKPVSVKK